jgi:hypothetical protein
LDRFQGEEIKIFKEKNWTRSMTRHYHVPKEEMCTVSNGGDGQIPRRRGGNIV